MSKNILDVNTIKNILMKIIKIVVNVLFVVNQIVNIVSSMIK